jgi:hypothetical protein
MTGKRRVAAIVTILALVAVAKSASAHRIDAHVSRAGLAYLAELAPAFVPDRLTPPPMSQRFLCAELEQRDTVVDLVLHDLSLDVPRDGVLRLELEISVEAEGELYLNNLYSCFGEETCRDHLSLSHARAIVEFQIEVEDERPRLTIHDVQLLIEPEDISIQLSGCTIDGVFNTVIGWTQSLALDFILRMVGDAAASELAPMLEELLAGFMSFEGHFGPSMLEASLRGANVTTDGVFIAADLGLRSVPQAPAGCLTSDAAPPSTRAGLPPNLAGGVPGHVGVAINLGLVDDVLFNAWRAGLMCLNSAYFAALGIDLELDYHAGKMLPGFPANTRFSFDVRVMEPPSVRASEAADAALTLVVRGLEVDLRGRYPGGADTIRIAADLEASARLGVDRDTSALVLRPEGVRISRLEIDDTVGGESLGVDAAGLAHMLETYVVPTLVGELGAVPVSGSIVGLEDFYVLLRDVFTTEGYLAAKVDLFRAPDDDTGRPTTAIERRPEGLVALKDAIVRVTGTDPEIPTELLRYRVIVDGEERPLSFVRDIPVGVAGRSGRYRVQVSAVDLAGNEDPNPLVLEVDVDGVAPVVALEGGVTRTASGVTERISWRQSDDLTEASQLVPRVLLYRVHDTANLLDVELLTEIELPAGTTSYEVPLGAHDLYRVEVRVRDQAGNEGVASTLVTVKTGGCLVSAQASSSGAGGAMLLGLALFALAAIRRRPAQIRST